jgi:hypothetical protein
MRSRVAVAVGIGCGLGLSAWVSCGLLAATEATGTPGRVGLLPPWWMLGAAVVAAALVLAVLARFTRLALAPLLLPLATVIPWLPVPLPAAVLIWTGPAVVAIWIATVVGTCCLSVQAMRPKPVALLYDPRRASMLAFGAAFVLYVAASGATVRVFPGGDEPHYLVITQSLLQDGDLRVANNYEQEDYSAYFGGVLAPHSGHPGQDGQMYSIHSPGLPALILPAFAVAGYRGVTVFLAALAALVAAVVWRLGFQLTRRADAAWLGWAAVVCSAPTLIQAFSVYPDTAAGLAVMVGVAALVSLDCEDHPAWRWPSWLGIGAVLAVLPWLHTRCAVAEAVLGVCLALRLLARRERLKLGALAVVPALSALGWLLFFRTVYGELSPAAPYGGAAGASLANVPRGLMGLWFDQQYGILPNAPVFAAALAGFVPLFRVRRRLAVELILLLVAYLTVVCSYGMWWGGWSTPGRFAVPVLAVLGLPAAVAWANHRSTGRAVVVSVLVLTAAITLVLVSVEGGRLIFADHDGASRWLSWATPVVDLPRAFPTLFRGTLELALIMVAIWGLVIGAAIVVLDAVRLRASAMGRSVGAALALGGPLSAVAAITVASGLAWGVSGAVGVTPTESGLDLLRRFAPAVRPIGVQTDPPALVAARLVPSRLLLVPPQRRSPAIDAPLLSLFGVPSGVYELVPISSAGRGTVTVTIGRDNRPVARWTLEEAARPEHLTLRLPVPVDALIVSGDSRARASGLQVAWRPVAVVPRGERSALPSASRAARYENVAVYTSVPAVFFEDDGVWVLGGVRAPIAFASDRAAPTIRLHLRNGSVQNRVTLDRAGWSSTLSFLPGEERTLDLPVDLWGSGVALELKPDRGFRPSECDASSRDRRLLGIWIRPVGD